MLSSGTITISDLVTGTPQLQSLTGSGSIDVFGTVTITGTPQLQNIGATGTVTAVSDVTLADLQAQITALTVLVDAIKSKTDSLTFTVAGQVDSNLKSIADTANSTQLTECLTATGFATVNPDNAGIAAAQTAAESANTKATNILADTADMQPKVSDLHNAEGLDAADPVTISGDGETSSTITTTRLEKTITPTSITRTT